MATTVEGASFSYKSDEEGGDGEAGSHDICIYPYIYIYQLIKKVGCKRRDPPPDTSVLATQSHPSRSHFLAIQPAGSTMIVFNPPTNQIPWTPLTFSPSLLSREQITSHPSDRGAKKQKKKHQALRVAPPPSPPASPHTIAATDTSFFVGTSHAAHGSRTLAHPGERPLNVGGSLS